MWAAAGASLLAGGLATAVSTASFELATFKDLDAGEPKGTLVSSEGEVVVGRGSRAIKGVKWPMVWSRARGADGTVYFGTGDPGKVIAVKNDKVRVVADVKAVLVTALAVGPGNTLFAATLPDAKILAIDVQSGKWRQLSKVDAVHVWALLYDGKARRLYAASGAPGKLFSIPPSGGKATVYFDPGEKHLLSLARERSGALLVGSSDRAILYRVTAANQASAVHDFDATELRDVVVTKRGVIYVGVNKFRLKTSGLPRLDKDETGKGGTALRTIKQTKKPKVQQSELRPGAKQGQGALYRIDPDGRVEELLTLPKGYFTDLAVDADGLVWAAEGTEGKVYQVRRDRTVLSAFDLRERQVLALAVGGKGDAQYLATGDAGAIYRVTGRAKTPAYLSKVLDAQFNADWGTIRFRATGPLRLSSRSGNTAKPDKTWSDWVAARNEGPGRARLNSASARYLQLRAEWSGGADTILRSLAAYYGPQNQRTRVTEIKIERPKVTDKKPRTPNLELSWKVENPDKDELVYRLYYREELGVGWARIQSPEPITKLKHTWDTETVPDGYYRIKVVASDEPANGPEQTLKGSRVSAPVLVDNRKPVIVGLSILAPWVSGMARDSYANIQQVAFSIDGGPWRMVGAGDGIYDTATETFRFRLPRQLTPGAHILAVRALDAADNVGVARQRFVY